MVVEEEEAESIQIPPEPPPQPEIQACRDHCAHALGRSLL